MISKINIFWYILSNRKWISDFKIIFFVKKVLYLKVNTYIAYSNILSSKSRNVLVFLKQLKYKPFLVNYVGHNFPPPYFFCKRFFILVISYHVPLFDFTNLFWIVCLYMFILIEILHCMIAVMYIICCKL